MSPQPAETFYLRKMSVTPMGVFDEVDQTGVVYLFSQRHGKTNSNHVASILEKHIESLKMKGRNRRKLRLQLDNCSVNKCYMLIRYAAYLLNTGLYDEIEICFMVAGHTKFSPDRMFSWLTGILRDIDVFEVDDIVAASESARRVHLSQQGKELSYRIESLDSFTDDGYSEFFFDWNSYFDESFRRFGYLNDSHVFSLRWDSGEIALHVKEFCDSEPIPTSFIKDHTLPEFVYRLEKVPLKAAKVQDLRKMLKYIPSGRLSYVDPMVNSQP